MTHAPTGPTFRSEAAVSTARVALVVVGGLWALMGVFLFSLLSPVTNDGVYWSMVDPISDEYAAELQQQANLSLTVGFVSLAVHLTAALVCLKSWGRWPLMIIGGLYAAAVLPLAAESIQAPVAGALPVYAGMALLMGALLLNASRVRKPWSRI